MRVVQWDQLPHMTKALVWLPYPSKPTEALLGQLDVRNLGWQAKDFTYRQGGLQSTLGEDLVE